MALARNHCFVTQQLECPLRLRQHLAMKRKTTERLSFDARGLPQWEERIAPGEYQPRSSDSRPMRVLKADELSLADTQRTRVLHNPYGNSHPDPKPLKARSKLDYMRALSETIKIKRLVERGGGDE